MSRAAQPAAGFAAVGSFSRLREKVARRAG